MASTGLFISDLHLDPERPASTDLFRRFLNGPAAKVRDLYILGDFLEYWLGDDDDPRSLRPALDELKALAGSGCRVALMHGNRDFLLGDTFATRFGLQLISDPTLIRLGGAPVLLTHGDLLCTDDLPYQEFRKQVRASAWRDQFLSKPIFERREIVRQLRATSRRETRAKQAEIMDVNQDAVNQLMRQHGVTYLIHGHTHRPGIHRFETADGPARRIVLGDWYQGGSYLYVDDSGFRLSVLEPDGASRVLAEAPPFEAR